MSKKYALVSMSRSSFIVETIASSNQLWYIKLAAKLVFFYNKCRSRNLPLAITTKESHSTSYNWICPFATTTELSTRSMKEQVGKFDSDRNDALEIVETTEQETSKIIH